jgi:hypothetical protein
VKEGERGGHRGSRAPGQAEIEAARRCLTRDDLRLLVVIAGHAKPSGRNKKTGGLSMKAISTGVRGGDKSRFPGSILQSIRRLQEARLLRVKRRSGAPARYTILADGARRYLDAEAAKPFVDEGPRLRKKDPVAAEGPD